MDGKISWDSRRLNAFVNILGNSLGIKEKNRYLIEKDLYLTIILNELQKTKFHQDLVFKGGTCLAKVYLDYHRFSEDLDFTWKDQQIFKGKSMKQIRKICSKLIDEIGEALYVASERYLFDFKFEKNNRRYVQLGGSNKLVTFLIWFDSLSGQKSLIKIQINFLEDLEFPVLKKELEPLTLKFPKNEAVYFGDILEFYEDLVYYVYDVREIACEKVRTLLTRRTVKIRDVVDFYLIHKKFDINFEELKIAWVRKVKFAIETYEKYLENFKKRVALTREEFVPDEINYLLLVEIDQRDFEKFMDEFLNSLNRENKGITQKLTEFSTIFGRKNEKW